LVISFLEKYSYKNLQQWAVSIFSLDTMITILIQLASGQIEY